jgi:hypothetical protein
MENQRKSPWGGPKGDLLVFLEYVRIEYVRIEYVGLE